MPSLVDVVLALPAPPPLDGVGDTGRDGVGSGRLAAGALGRRPPDREPELVAFDHRERGAHRAAVDLRRYRGTNDDLVRAAERAATIVSLTEQRAHQSVLGARCELHHDVDRARDADERSQQLARRFEAEVVTALSLREGERVEQPDRAGLGRERRVDDERAREIATFGCERARGSDRPVAGVGVEDAGEDGWAVEPWQAQPVDRPVIADERRGGAIGEQAVRGDRSRAPGGRTGGGQRCDGFDPSCPTQQGGLYDATIRPTRTVLPTVRSAAETACSRRRLASIDSSPGSTGCGDRAIRPTRWVQSRTTKGTAKPRP